MSAKEIIDYKKCPGNNLEKIKYDLIQKKPWFTIYIQIKDVKDFEIRAINSIFNQTFSNFEVFIFGSNKEIKILKKLITFSDKRLYLFEDVDSVKKNLLDNSKADYLIPMFFDCFLDKTYLETIYYNTRFSSKSDIIYTNVIDINRQQTFNQALISRRKRIIDFFSKVYCYKKELLNYIDINKDEPIFSISNYNVKHLNFYGVWQTNVINHKRSITGQFIDYPRSNIYDYGTEPQNCDLVSSIVKSEKSILCMMPWCKIGGADIFNINVIKYLKQNGFSIYIICTEKCPYEGRQLLEEYTDGYFDLNTFLAREEWADFIKNIIISKDIKLIFQMNSLYGYHLIPWLKYKFPELPIIDYLHAEDFSWRCGGYPKDSTSVAQFIDKTYTCSAHLKDLMFDKMGRTLDNVETLYIGVDTDKFNPGIVKITDRETLDFCKGKKVLLFPSRFSFEKRPLFLLNLMKKISKNRDDIVCLMVGDGVLKYNVEKYIEKHDLKSCVRVLPMQLDVRQYYKMADIVVICSLTEGITLTTYEALAMNDLVISADVGGQSEVISPECGVIIERYQDVKKDLYNYNYDPKEIERYEEEIYKLLDRDKQNYSSRDIVLNKFSHAKLFSTIETDINKLIKQKSSFNKKLLVNEMFYVRFLVLFNEMNKEYYNNSFEYDDFKQYLKNKMWKKWWWRSGVNIGKKLKIDKIVKEIYFRGK